MKGELCVCGCGRKRRSDASLYHNNGCVVKAKRLMLQYGCIPAEFLFWGVCAVCEEEFPMIKTQMSQKNTTCGSKECISKRRTHREVTPPRVDKYRPPHTMPDVLCKSSEKGECVLYEETYGEGCYKPDGSCRVEPWQRKKRGLPIMTMKLV